MFLIRVELHNTVNYEPLHAAMERRGMLRTITASDGRVCILPTGTYYQVASSTAVAVRQEAESAAREAGHPNAMIVVANASEVVWSGLPAAYRKGA